MHTYRAPVETGGAMWWHHLGRAGVQQCQLCDGDVLFTCSFRSFPQKAREKQRAIITNPKCLPHQPCWAIFPINPPPITQKKIHSRTYTHHHTSMLFAATSRRLLASSFAHHHRTTSRSLWTPRTASVTHPMAVQSWVYGSFMAVVGLQVTSDGC